MRLYRGMPLGPIDPEVSEKDREIIWRIDGFLLSLPLVVPAIVALAILFT